MISRTYVVKMPTSVSTTALDILVQNNPGTQAAPVVAGSDGAYYEFLGRPLRIPVEAGGAPPTAAAIAAGFVPRLRLGCLVSITPIKASISTDLPGVQLSSSLASLASTDSGPTIAVPALADPSGGPAIRLTGGAGTAGLFFLVSLQVVEGKDSDRSAMGV
jgi:hypothetical protein